MRGLELGIFGSSVTGSQELFDRVLDVGDFDFSHKGSHAATGTIIQEQRRQGAAPFLIDSVDEGFVIFNLLNECRKPDSGTFQELEHSLFLIR